MANKFIKILLISFFLCLHLNYINAQIDSEAVAILDKMSGVLGNLKSCSFTVNSNYDIYNNKLGLVKHSDNANVFLKAPDKFLVNKNGDKGKKDFYYDGKMFTYFSPNSNQYSAISAPATIMKTIDSLHNTLGIDFPAADLFYPYFVDDLLDVATNLSYLGLTSIDNKECFHIAGTTNEYTYQFWISNDESVLPVKMAIIYTNKTGNPQFEAEFQNWNLNPSLDDSMFNFTVPSNAVKIKFAKPVKN